MVERPEKRTKGARNLFLMGFISILIAISTTGVSLAIYHNSGDIYLDRSRPGFLPDKEEIEEDEGKSDDEYDFAKSGVLTESVLDEYLENLKEVEGEVEAFEKPFDAKVLTDENLGIISGGMTGATEGENHTDATEGEN